jgi:uncharacterized protein YjiS (DUF1127 family)
MSLINLIAAVVKAFPESHREDAYAELMALDDHSLADIGLRRPEIAAGLCGRSRAIDGAPGAPTGCRAHPGVADGYFPPF